jgi:hypothetical protein
MLLAALTENRTEYEVGSPDVLNQCRVVLAQIGGSLRSGSGNERNCECQLDNGRLKYSTEDSNVHMRANA